MSLHVQELSFGARLKHRARVVAESFKRNPTMLFGVVVLLLMAVLAFLAPWLGLPEPMQQSPRDRLQPPSPDALFGTDMYGRDLFSRVLHGGQVSLVVGLTVATLATSFGLAIGLVSGFVRSVDAVIMRLMDALMSIPSILLAIALVALWGSSVPNVILALTIPEIPRVVRLVRSVVLMLRDQLYVQAAIACGTSTPRILIRHILPNTIPPLIVQATYICAQAVIFEAYLSFVGAGTPPEIPSWGNIMAEGRMFFFQSVGIILYPGAFLALTVFAINTFGDGLRDSLDPRMQRRV
ncbi:ABC transporter permease [Roseovarius gahaiensis]|uniref:ABC transporter permease n=1 Tax=Roseovarius gahaiensis TaxID=2716691 RepID=A0A967EGD9_9RHOB|nr:ABC transporter permease [Roseovarius gahaiensis]NHQ74836.1 ABC transporter permease [Roseovarius gahaiensis]